MIRDPDTLARANDAHVEVIYVAGPGAVAEDEAQAILDATVAELEDVETSAELVEGEDVVDAIVERSSEHDVTVIGASREGLLQQLVFGAIPEEVGRRAKHTVIMAKRDLGLTSQMTRWFRSHRP